MNNYNKEIQKKELEFEKKLEERLEKIKKGKYSYEKLNKVKEFREDRNSFFMGHQFRN